MKKDDRYDSLVRYWWEKIVTKDIGVTWYWAKAMIAQESGFDPKATSPVQAKGLLQLMKGTWGPGFDDEWSNPEENIKKGVSHFWFLWKLFGDEEGIERVRFGTGAYNCGQGWVIKAQAILKTRGKPTDVWALIAQELPFLTGPSNARETAHYVSAVEKYYNEFRGVE